MSAVPKLHVAPTEADYLRADIADLCHQIDRRLHRPPGTTERGIYFWHWPPQDITSVDVLTRLHLDAATVLFETVHTLR